MTVDGKSFPFSCNSTITYSPDEKQQSMVLAETVQVSAVDISHPYQSDTLKIEMTSAVQRGMKMRRLLRNVTLCNCPQLKLICQWAVGTRLYRLNISS